MNFRLPFILILCLTALNYKIQAQQLPLTLPGQDTGTTLQQSQYTFDLGKQDFTALMKESKLNQSVDPDEYPVDSGDQFAIKIDSKGPGIKLFQAIVTPDGYVFLPQAKSIFVKHLLLKDARKKIIQELKRNFPSAQIEVFLAQLHYVNVRFVSPLTKSWETQFTSNKQLTSAVDFFLQKLLETEQKNQLQKNQSKLPDAHEQYYFSPQNLDSLYHYPHSKPDLRHVQLIRRGKIRTIDFLKYKNVSQNTEHIYLVQDDIIKIPAYNEGYHNITIQGAVAGNFRFPYLPGDRLIDAIHFAGGLVGGADLNRILVYHYGEAGDTLRISRLHLPADSSYLLEPQDYILAQFKKRTFAKGRVKVLGQVRYPGDFPIVDNGVRLTQIIRQAGGFTSKASLKDARIYRTKFYKGEPNLGVFLTIKPQDMDINLLSYIGVRSREDVRILATDLNKLYNDHDQSQDVLLRDGDLLYIPQPVGIVFISGAVAQPGTYPYHKNWHYQDYIKAAGGYTNLAREGSTRIIRSGSAVWLESDDELPIYAGDMVFVPESTEVRWQTVIKDLAVVLGQVATVAYMITLISRGK